VTCSYVTTALWLPIGVSDLPEQEFRHFKIRNAFYRLPLDNEWLKIYKNINFQRPFKNLFKAGYNFKFVSFSFNV
jgi:hypothetical protein